MLYEAHKQRGDYQKALYYSEQSQKLKEENINEELDRQYNELNRKFESEQKNAQIVRLENEKLLEKQSRERLSQYGLLGLSALLTLIVGLVIWSNRKLRTKNRQITESLLRGQKTERGRIAAELHDNLGSTLTAIRWNFIALNPQTLSEHERLAYVDLQRMLNAAYDEVRLLSHNLLPSVLEKQGLESALKQLVLKLNWLGNVRFSLETTPEATRTDSQTAFELYSITLELVNNILKHAQATEASIALRCVNGYQHLLVEDNGLGSSVSDDRTGLGMQTIQQQVQALNGTWEWAAGSAGGAQVSIRVPLKKTVGVTVSSADRG
ncbi:MAG: histidine kinase [Cytophagaceae bacterium]|nr:histidine kinase [Cytophagaceae bacterium]